ncbi:MAG: hypothetical protein Q9225_005276 [Loekoesia sp. 1 TL-2023]
MRSHLRDARSAKICVLVEHDDDNHFMEYMVDTLLWKDPVGAYLKPDDPWNDEEDQNDSDQVFTELYLALGLLSGRTVGMMRFDRFDSWYTDMLVANRSTREIMNKQSKLRRTCHRNISENSIDFNGDTEGMRAFVPQGLYRPDAQLKRSAVRISAKYVVKAIDLNNEWDQASWHGKTPSSRHSFFWFPSFHRIDLEIMV